MHVLYCNIELPRYACVCTTVDREIFSVRIIRVLKFRVHSMVPQCSAYTYILFSHV